METPSTKPLHKLRDLIGEQDSPPLLFHYEPGIIDVHNNADPPPTISKLSEHNQMQKM
jgi:hypothetical protein